MPRDYSLKKVLIIGSGPIIIGQAAEFDYAGTQACKAISEEGIETVLINSNPATIMTDKGIADKVYLEPITEDAVTKIIQQERPDGVLAGFGGQTGLNLAMALDEKGIFEKYGVKLLGVNKESIHKAEDREAFKELMGQINGPVLPSIIATGYEECRAFAEEIGYPVIIRPAYTLGGTRGGIAHNERELREHCDMGVAKSAIGQILVEKSIAGWKEIEYEVMRDSKDNCIVVCSMENLDPAGIHTGDSIVVAPTQTLNDTQYQMLRDSALKIIRSLKIEGGCNAQFALNPDRDEYIVIEVNPRVSRSSALASKAAGYPIAKIAAKIAIGYSLDELKNYVTEGSSACFEPALDYCVVKIPKWPFNKFRTASRKLGTQMKATGEIMAIDRYFEAALSKAISSLELEGTGLRIPYVTGLSNEKLTEKLRACDDERIFCIAEIFRRQLMTLEEVFAETKIDRWFLNKLKGVVDMEELLRNSEVTAELIEEAEHRGFEEEEIMALTGVPRDVLQDIRIHHDIYPVYKVVYSDAELKKYLKEAVRMSHEHPVLIDKYVEGREMDVDAVADGEDVLIPGIMEHFERTGVHYGDSCTTSYPPYDLPQEVIAELVESTKKIAKALHIVGLVNIQYAWDGEQVYVIEVNPRASRTVPILSKVTGIPMVKIAVDVMTGSRLAEMEWGTGLYPDADYYAVKIPVFSDAKLTDVDVAVGPEMKSTGEVLGIDSDFSTAVYKGFLGAGGRIPTAGSAFVSLKDHDKTEESAEIIREYEKLGFRLLASRGTGEYLREHGLKAEQIDYGEVIPRIVNGEIQIVINTPKAVNRIGADTFPIRRAAIERNLPVMTCMDTAELFLHAVRLRQEGKELTYSAL